MHSFEPWYRQFGLNMPPLLEILVSWSNAIQIWGVPLVMVASIAAIVGWACWSHCRPLANLRQRWFDLPLVHGYAHQRLVSRLALDLGTLLRAGIGERAAFALAAAQQTSGYATCRLAAAAHVLLHDRAWSLLGALEGILPAGEWQQLRGCVSGEALGHSLQELAEIHAQRMRVIETRAVRALLGILFMVLVLFFNMGAQMLFLAGEVGRRP